MSEQVNNNPINEPVNSQTETSDNMAENSPQENDVTQDKSMSDDKATPETEIAPEDKPLLDDLGQKNSKLEDRLRRLMADYDNFRKRTQKERLEWRDNYHNEVLEELLPVLDNFELALKSIPENPEVKSFAEGMLLVQKQLLDILSKFGVTPVNTQGQSFDPHFHEAMSVVETPDLPDNSIVDEIRKGYLHGDKIVRPALVRVSKQPTE